MKFDIEKFSLGQMTSNSDGKTSGTGTMGILICTIGTLCFFMGSIDKMFLSKTTDIMTQAIIFVGMGAGLLGYRKSQEKNIVTTETQIIQPASATTGGAPVVADVDSVKNIDDIDTEEKEIKPLNS